MNSPLCGSSRRSTSSRSPESFHSTNACRKPSGRKPLPSTSHLTAKRLRRLASSPIISWGMDELEALRIRDEVLQAMYWMRSEGISEAPAVDELARFLAVPAATLAPYLERFVVDGYLEHEGDCYRLTDQGQDAGKRTFAEEFAGMTGQAHGECDEDCWCHQ